MKVIFINTEGESLVAKVQAENQIILVIDEFSNPNLYSGDHLEVELFVMNESVLGWEELLESNRDKKTKLDALGGCAYGV